MVSDKRYEWGGAVRKIGVRNSLEMVRESRCKAQWDLELSDKLSDSQKPATYGTWNRPQADIRYGTDGKLFNLWRLQAKTKIHVDRLWEFLFADDWALNAKNKADMQLSINLLSTSCDICLFVSLLNV